MRSLLSSLIIAALLVGGAQAEQPKQQCIGDDLKFQGLIIESSEQSLQLKTESGLDFQPNMEAYKLDLKPLRANQLSELQLNTVNNLGQGAGYASPYLWEVGQGPGFRGNGVFRNSFPGAAPPVPYRVRR